MTLTVLAVNVNSPSPERAERQKVALLQAGADVLVLTEVRKSAGGEKLVSGLRASGYQVIGWESSFEGFTTLVATTVPHMSGNAGAGRVQHVALQSDPPMSILAAYGVSSDPFGRNTADKVATKREWLGRFAQRVREEARTTDRLLVIGDLNFVDERNLPQYRAIYDFEKQAYADMISTPLSDLLADSADVTWTSHQGQGFRFDHAFATEALRGQVVSATLDHEWRAGEDRLTDHSAVRVEMAASFAPAVRESAAADEPDTLF